MKRKLLLVSLSCMLMFGLTACGHEHTWQEANCTSPKTCVECGEIEGEALGHAWIDATCSTSKTCSGCGETEGEALGHTWADATCSVPKTCNVCGETEGEILEHTLAEANYQQAATCMVCGATEGEPLQATEYSIAEGAKLDIAYDFEIPCYGEDADKSTVSKVTFTDYQIFEADDSHPAKEGYEWKTVVVNCVVGDPTAWDYGYQFDYWYADYYSYETNENGTFTVNFYGTDYTECELHVDASTTGWIEKEQYGWLNTVTVQYNVSVLCPKNYDGFIWGLYDLQSNFWDVEEEGDYWNQISPSDYIYFRFN